MNKNEKIVTLKQQQRNFIGTILYGDVDKNSTTYNTITDEIARLAIEIFKIENKIGEAEEETVNYKGVDIVE